MSRRLLASHEYSFTVLYERIGKSGFQVTVPSLPGLVTYGRTFDEARTMARDAIRCHVGGLQRDEETIPDEQSIIQEHVTVHV